jgi:hypothetical protein
MSAAKRPVVSEATLPVPRLELRWGKPRGDTRICDYNLVLELGPYDIRHKKRAEYTGRCAEMRVRLGRTKVTGGTDRARVYRDEAGVAVSIDTPFRDSSHIAWDGHQLKLRAFVVADGLAQELETRANKPAAQEAKP